MIFRPLRIGHSVNCRIGSLENDVMSVARLTSVNCRIGSLENGALDYCFSNLVNCRIGSLEMY